MNKKELIFENALELNNYNTIDHIYYNVVVVNNDPVSPIPITYDTGSLNIILDNPSLYYASVVRFKCPLEQVPIFVFVDNLYSVTISYLYNDFKSTLIYVPHYNPALVTAPDAAFTRYVYSYQQFLDSINNGLTSSMIALAPAYSSSIVYIFNQTISYSGNIYVSLLNGNLNHQPDISPSYWTLLGLFQAPFMSFNPVTQLCSLNTPSMFFNPSFNVNTQPLKICFNTNLWVFFSNFEKIFNGYTPSAINTNGKNYNIIVKDNGFNSITEPLIGYQMTQEFISLSDWNSLRSIVIQSSLPIRAEQLPSVKSGVINTNSTTANFSKILTDFEIVDNGALRNNVTYFPQAEYRLVDLYGSDPLQNIHIDVFWRDKNLNLTRIFLNPLDSFDMKILFRRKHYIVD